MRDLRDRLGFKFPVLWETIDLPSKAIDALIADVQSFTHTPQPQDPLNKGNPKRPNQMVPSILHMGNTADGANLAPRRLTNLRTVHPPQYGALAGAGFLHQPYGWRLFWAPGYPSCGHPSRAPEPIRSDPLVTVLAGFSPFLIGFAVLLFCFEVHGFL